MSCLRSKTSFLLLIITFLLATLLTGCGKAAAPVTEKKETISKLAPDQQLSTIYDINRIVDLSPIKIRIVNVGVVKFTESTEDAKGQIALGLEIANIGDKEVHYMPEQITLTTQAGKTLLPNLDVSEMLGGAYPAKRTLQGFMVFHLGNINPEEVKQLKIQFPAPVDQAKKPVGQEKQVLLELKKE